MSTHDPADIQPVNTRFGFVALIGAPNSGKSTLMNTMVGQKIAIVTHKVQTTRSRITGIAIEGSSQIVFVDTPGIFAPRRRLDRAMVQAAWNGADDADLIVALVDSAKGYDRDVERIIDGLSGSRRKAILALNKVDLVNKDTLLGLASRLNATDVFSATFMISALSGDGVADLKHHLALAVPAGRWLYPEDQITDITQRLLASEITREKLYLRLHQEVPYAIAVETEKFEQAKDRSYHIHQVVHVSRDSQKGIVIGKGGKTLKAVGAAARTELEEIFGARVHLFLFVRVSEKWMEDRDRYLDLGLDYVE